MQKSTQYGGRPFEFVPWHRRPAGKAAREFTDRLAALDFLHSCAGDGPSVDELRALLTLDMTSLDVSGLQEDDMFDLLAERLVRGDLVVVEGPARSGGSAGGGAKGSSTGASQEDEDDEAPVGAAPATEKSWIEFIVVDDETGEPRAGVKLELRLPGGSISTFQTGANGVVRITDLSPGTCDLRRVGHADVLEVVRLES